MWQARKNEEEKCRLYFAKVYESKKGEAMKTKTEYEKLEYDFWNLSELKEIFEKGDLYYHSRDYFFKFETLLDVGTGASMGDTIYKRVETPVTLEDDLLEIAQADHGRNLEFIYDDGKLNIYDDIFYRAGLEPEIIHALSEALKRHGK